MALNYSRTKKMAELSKDELTHLAAKAKISEKLVIDTAAETVKRFKQVWAGEKANLPLEKRSSRSSMRMRRRSRFITSS
jgi:serine/threonine-protein kinase HipA